jgi:hypothetical protein
VNDITLLDSWVISAQGHFTKNTDLFPRKISKSFNGCPMKAVVRVAYSALTTLGCYSSINTSGLRYVTGLELDLLMLVLEHMNMTFVHVPTPSGFDIEYGLTNNLTESMIAKNAYIALGAVGTYYLDNSFIASTNAYIVMSSRWYVPCPAKYPRWSSIFRILSVELWVVLLISIVIAAISTTLIGRYSCTSEWQGYKTLTNSLTNIWAVILGVSVPTMPRTPSLRSLFLAWVCFSIAFTTVFQAFLTTFVVDSGYNKPFRNINEVSAAGISFIYSREFNFLFDYDKTLVSKVETMRQKDVEITDIMEWIIQHKNISLFLDDFSIETFYAGGEFVGENGEPLMCKLKDGLVYNNPLSMVMFHGDPLLRRVSEIVDRVIEAGLYNHWIALKMDSYKVHGRKIALVNLLDGYYSFNIHHMQPAFYFLLMGWCLSSICFMVELLYNRFLSKRE